MDIVGQVPGSMLKDLHVLSWLPVLCRVTQVRPFDTESAKSSYATGFVVDKEKGLILTNRHVATPGTA